MQKAKVVTCVLRPKSASLKVYQKLQQIAIPFFLQNPPVHNRHVIVCKSQELLFYALTQEFL